MRRRRVACSLWLVGGLLAGAGAAQAPKQTQDVILRAMRDELARTRPMRLAALAPAYFIEYALHDGELVSSSATLGALVNTRRTRYRLPRVQVRVGGYDSDNTNFVGTGFYSGTRWDVDLFPLDDSYAALRHHLWLATDVAYKAAVESMGRKRAVLRSIAPGEQLADFARAEPLDKLMEGDPGPVNQEAWNARLRRLSAIFEDYTEVFHSLVEFDHSRSVHYLVNSEGTAVRVPEGMMQVRVRATAQAPDGMPLRDSAAFSTLSAASTRTGSPSARFCSVFTSQARASSTGASESTSGRAPRRAAIASGTPPPAGSNTRCVAGPETSRASWPKASSAA